MESPKHLDSNSVEYWKEQAKYYEQKSSDIQQELDEYTENSAQLEKELEASLAQVEKQNRDLEHQNQRLRNEIEMLRSKLERSQHETNALENELKALKIDKEKQAIYIRELEQKNDDLERGQRIISESVSCIETLLNQAYERNAVLESEVDEIENLRVNLQRVTDEARDLKQELKVIEKIPILKKEESSTNEPLCNGHSARTQVEIETQTSMISPAKREVNGNAMTPSSRVSAINLVGDLLRKVGLERFLCRECGKVKCSCGVQTPTEQNPQLHAADAVSDKELEQNDLDESVEFRKPSEYTRQYSRSEHPIHLQRPLPLSTPRPSEQPFERSYQSENGKLRRSFIVRSREGLETFLNFTSTRKGQDQGKGKQMLRQQF
ncbi:nuclear distribution protein nudE-like 1 isoform X1 [Maniola jurtina]|uniref:nuclear distribution protein nudE-like 1 isoform X1 n=1 Tax=Maniola jurtina TaxID=191418 RepID=UPI001E6872BB|nr:nuclear distribution protein nudE-like 1 isoform X1 [Maniola jurtina]XP_045772287.1 nuclear distribution protein nudE-like 1 isoform X1 [Maniola jurtina]